MAASAAHGCLGPGGEPFPSSMTPALQSGSVAALRHAADCMVCGASLHYLQEETPYPCAFCGAVLPANARCERGHFVCDACHTRDADAFLEHICLTTRETDMLALFQEIRSHPAIPVHGPEHHILVPGIILATYRNLGGEVPVAMLRTALRRGKAVPGGYCAFTGACGAGVGVGIAFSLLLGANPVKARERQQVQEVTQAVLQEQASFAAARCCQRDCWIALGVGMRTAAEMWDLQLPAVEPFACTQMARNRQCLGLDCPLWPV